MAQMNRCTCTFKILITLYSLFVCSTLFAQVNPNGLLVHYPFNGDATDSSGNEYHGYTNATLTEDRFGQAEHAYHFNGINEYINFPNEDKLKPPFPFSFAFWVKFDTLQLQKGVIFTTDFAHDIYSGAWISLVYDGVVSAGYGDLGPIGASHRRGKYGTSSLQPNTWYHLAVVMSGPIDIQIYVDCMDDGGTYDGFGGPLRYTTNRGSIGRIDASKVEPPSYFKGSLDDFYFWERALTSEDIATLCKNISSTQDVNDLEFKVYPNPTSNYVELSYNEEIQGRVEIYNTFGQSFHEGILQRRIDIGSIPGGMYLISLTTPSSPKKYVRKLIVR